MSKASEPAVPPDKQTPPDKQMLRRRLRAERRSLAPELDRGADASGIAGALLDSLMSPSDGRCAPGTGL